MATTMRATGRAKARAEGQYFYVWMGVAFVAIAVLGFVPSYWARVATASFDGPRILHVHGPVLTAWVLFYLVQAWLVARGRTIDHRDWGQAGIALFTLVICTILATQLAILQRADLAGYGDAARRFAAVPLLGVPVMVGLFAAAIAFVRRPDIHRRLMVVLMAGFMSPAIARMFIFFLVPGGSAAGPPPPPIFAVPPSLIAILLVVVGMVRDWRTIGRVHHAYVWGALVLLVETLLVPPIASTTAWMAMMHGFEGLAG